MLNRHNVDFKFEASPKEVKSKAKVVRSPTSSYPEGIIVSIPYLSSDGVPPPGKEVTFWMCSPAAMMEVCNKVYSLAKEVTKKKSFPLAVRLKKPLRVWDDAGYSYSWSAQYQPKGRPILVQEDWTSNMFVTVTFPVANGQTVDRKFPTRKCSIDKGCDYFEDYFEEIDDEADDQKQ